MDRFIQTLAYDDATSYVMKNDPILVVDVLQELCFWSNCAYREEAKYILLASSKKELDLYFAKFIRAVNDNMYVELEVDFLFVIMSRRQCMSSFQWHQVSIK